MSQSHVRGYVGSDADDLVAWRAAELLATGIEVRLIASHQRDSSVDLHHVRLQLPDGTIEDPSRLLGMP